MSIPELPREVPQPGDAPDLPDTALIRQVTIAIRAGARISDETFDRLLPHELARVSRTFWTPLEVARCVAGWLDELGIEVVLDIGSGAGKFCVAAALAGTGRFVGLEQRVRLVGAARTLARRFGVDDRVTFLTGALEMVPRVPITAYYLYNPFGENTFGPAQRLDDEVELSSERLRRDVATMERLLLEAPLGTYVITYNGFGGRIPSTYVQIRTDWNMPNMLRMWQKLNR